MSPEKPMGEVTPDDATLKLSTEQRAAGTGHPSRGPAWVPPTLDKMQRLLPQFEFIEMVGAGGMGAVFKAKEPALDRPVAIKILPPDLDDGRGGNFTERFKQEARTMAKLNHPAILKVHDFGQTADGQFYFVMEFVEGTDVQKMIRANKRIALPEALAITAQVCAALEYAHAHGVLHRDIKPANVLVGAGGAVKLADFGIAKFVDGSTPGLTRADIALGTPHFMAPETLVADMKPDARADLYSVGVMLQNMLTGEIPKGTFKLPSQKTGCDVRIDAIVKKAMASDREERFQTATEIRQALDAISTTPVTHEARPSQTARPTDTARSRGKIIAAVVTGALAVLGGVVFFNGGREQSAVSKPTLAAKAPTPTNGPSAPLPPATPELGRTIDLLALVDVKRDAVAGAWALTTNGLSVESAYGTQSGRKGSARLQLPYAPPEEYDFEIEFTTGTYSNFGGDVSQLLVAGGHHAQWKIFGQLGRATNDTFFHFSWLDGVIEVQKFDRATRQLNYEAGKVVFGLPTSPALRHVSRVEVRKGRLTGTVDGTVTVDWSGDLGRFTVPPADQMPDPTCIGLQGAGLAVTFHRIAVREVSGRGTIVGNADAPPAGPWKSLSDGRTFDGWEKRGADFRIEDGAFVSSSIGYLFSTGRFLNFELELEWRINAGGNGGVFYGFAGENHFDGPECELCESPELSSTRSGALSGVINAKDVLSKAPGEWNSAKIVVNGNHREHWINGALALAYDTDSSAYLEAAHKVNATPPPAFLAAQNGRIGLQFHSPGSDVAYRNIRIRERPAVAP